MRAIDADFVIEKIRRLPNAGINWFVSAEAVFDVILNAPTIDPEPPQRTGRWLQIEDGIKVAQYRCSECGRTVCDDRGYDPCVDYPYCHCGARMEETNEAD